MKPTTLLLALAFAGLSAVNASEVIESVMKDAYKGDTSLYKTVTSGKGTKADAEKLLGLTKSMAAETPPEGDATSWKEKNDKLIAALQGVVEGKADATSTLKEAGNCKACHSAHKPK